MLKVHDVSYCYEGGNAALSNISLDIAPGERLAILGENGAGKSTLLLTLNGSLKPQSGTVEIDGRPARYDREGLALWRRTVGLVLQDPDDQLFAASVFEDVSFGPLNLGLDDIAVAAKVRKALAAMRIADLADRPTHLLSFGQRKRVALAGILAMEPRLLLLDEPTAGLDPVGVIELMATLDDVSAAGTAIVIATHDMDVAYGWAQRVAIFGERRIARLGAPEAVFDDQAMLERLRICSPLILDIASALRSKGLLPEGAPLPRSRAELLAVLAR